MHGPRRQRSATASLLVGPLSGQAQVIEERIRTLCLCVLAVSALAAALYYMRTVLIPLVMALALKYLLQPLIDLLTKRPLQCCGESCCDEAPPPSPKWLPARLRTCWDKCYLMQLPYGLAVVVALVVAFTILAIFGLVVADSLRVFTAKADTYSAQVQQSFQGLLGWMDTAGLDKSTRKEKLKQLADNVPVTQMIFKVGESILEVLSNLFLVVLFSVYLLIGGGDTPSSSSASGHGAGAGAQREEDRVIAQVDAQIFAYIKGKIILSLLTGAMTSIILAALGVDLWLVFGVLAFWLNFVPNVGAVIAVAAPMPVVLFDPASTHIRALLAFFLPMAVHGIVGNVLEPVFFGHSMDLHPVAVLLSLMVWGTLWGVTGMVLAVPITAVMRIHLSHIDHPMARYFTNLLIGRVTPVTDASDHRDLETELVASQDEHRRLLTITDEPASPLHEA